MSYENWKDRIGTFEVMDVRGKKMDFFPALKAKAAALKNGEGLHIIQTFEPHPLYAVMEGLGYERHTEQRGEAEFHVWFCRVEKKEGDSSAPFKPLALLNYPMIDEKLGQIAVDFWETTWQSEKRVLPYETRLLLSLTNAVGAGRMRQAEEYGRIQPGETPAREITLPRRTDGKTKVSRTVRTILEGKATPELALPGIKQLVAEGAFS